MKRILLLGGLKYLVPVIEAAHKLGCYVITCDYLPGNIAHKYSDEYINVSIIDKEAVLDVARRLHIDGIMSFAVDPGVITAAYVAEKLGLPSPPYDSVCILQNKDRFRAFLRENGFNTPRSEGFADKASALESSGRWAYPVIVKPTDSAGSKGVTRVDCSTDLGSAVDDAFSHSLCGRIIIEDFIEKSGFSTDTDSFSVNDELVFFTVNNQYFDDYAANPYTPAAYSWPSYMPVHYQKELRSEVQRLIRLLHLGTSIYNIETRISKDGKPYIMEVSPRGGGNRLAEIISKATGVDMVSAAVKAAIGEDLSYLKESGYNGHWAEIILHSPIEGEFRSLEVSEEVEKNYLVEKDLWARPGDEVHPFRGANDAIGTLVLRFPSEEELNDFMNNQGKYIHIMVGKKKAKKVLVLGATGQLGANASLCLKEAGYEVVAVGRRPSDNGFFATKGISFIGSFYLENEDSYALLPKDIDAVVHLAGAMPAHSGVSPKPYVESIVLGMVNLCEWMKTIACRRIIFNTTPSDVIALLGTDNPVDDDAPRSFPRDGGDHAVYAIAKNTAVDILEHYQDAYGFKPFILRHMTVYGYHPDPYYYLDGVKKMLPWRIIVQKAISGETVEVWGDPRRKKELLYVKDFADVIRCAVESDVTGLFNLGSDRHYSLEEQIDGIISAFGSDSHPRKVYCPEKPDSPQNLLKTEKIKEALHWHHHWDWNSACEDMKLEMTSNPFELLWGAAKK